MSKRSDLFYTFLHVPFDILALILAFITSYWLRGNGLAIYRLPFGEYLHLMGRSVALWIIIFALQGLYTKRYLFGTLQTMFHLAISVLAGWASFVVFLVFLKNEQTLVFPRLLLIYLLLFSFLYVFCGRIILRLVQYGLRRVGIGRSRVLLIGSGTIADSLSGALLQRNGISIDYINRLHSVDTETLARHFRQDHIDECYLADPSLGDTKTLEYLAAAYDHSVVCHLVPNMFEVQTSNVIFSTFGGLPIMTLRQTPLDGWGRIVKRLLDITLSVLGLIVLSPILVLVAVLVKITDPGPVFYAHTRISRGGKKIRVYKFRTMSQKFSTGEGYSGKSPIEVFESLGRLDLVEEFKRDQKVKDDPRVSPLGKLLRKTSIDELPQLMNVVRGDLSLVGPRPIVEDELKRYGKWSSYLLSIKPGITGLWQVSGRNNVSYDERVKLDTQYVQNWSLWQDLVIIIKTFAIVLVGHDGY